MNNRVKAATTKDKSGLAILKKLNESLSVTNISTPSDVRNSDNEINEREECIIIQGDTVEGISAWHNADTRRNRDMNRGVHKICEDI